jgi:Mn2+/Fe2+ NRAMP family transporter
VMMLFLVATNFTNVMAEFAGVASSMELFHVSKFISVPVAAAIVWLIVVKGNYKSVEKVFLTASFFYIAYIIAGVLSRPNWPAAVVSTVRPPHEAALFRVPGYVYMVTGIIGATIAPWMQFYLQASVVEKGVTMRHYNKTRIDVLVGSIFAPVVAGFIILACAATLYQSGHRVIRDAADAAVALGPLAGRWAQILFGAGLFNASLFAASILPLSTAYTVCEGLGFESGLDKKFSEASIFYWLYTVLVGAGAAVILLPRFPLLKMLVLSQVLNGVLLPFVLIFMLLLINKTSLMGKYVNSRFFNWVAWGTASVMIVLSVLLVFQ